MSEFNGIKITEYKDGRDAASGTLARGSTFNNEFNRLYENDNYLKDEIDKLGGASLDPDGAFTENSDLKVPTQRAVKTYVDSEISDLIAGAPSALDTLKELADALNNDAELATTLLSRVESSQQQNLVYNNDFRYFSNQSGVISSWYDYKHPDGWVYDDNGSDGKIGYDTNLECCKFQTSSDGSGARNFKQSLHEFVNWKKLLLNKKITLKAFVKGANALIKLTDGVSVQSYNLINSGAIEEVTLQLDIDSLATELTISIESSEISNIIQVYKVYANIGKYAIETLPCIVQGKIGELKSYDATEIPPAGEFQVYSMELPEGYTRLDSYIDGKFGRGVNGRSKLDDALGRYERNWSNGSTNDPDRGLRTDRGDGITGDRVGTKLDDQIKNHKHLLYSSNYGGAMDVYGLTLHSALGGRNLGTLDYRDTGTLQSTGGNQTNPIDRNILKTIRWC